jgi:hypothetical protein
MKFKPRGIAAKFAAATAITVGGLAMFGVPAMAGTSAGNATILDPASNKPLNTGGSTTTWTIGLPPQAHCTKDTATNAYHVYSYIVPASVNPNTLSFTSTGPTDPTLNPLDYPLVDTFGSPYIAANTAPNTGQVIQIPQFNWAAFSIDARGTTASLPAGTYNVGIACATGAGVEDVFWNVQKTFTAAASDPAGETWTAANPTTSVPETPTAILLPLSFIAIIGVGGGMIVLRRRRNIEAPIAV